MYEHRTASPSIRSVLSSNLQTQQQQPAAQTTEITTTADSGTFVDANGLPANSDVAVGVAQSGRVVLNSITQAYVVDDTASLCNLSGVYQKTINGIPAGQIVLSYDKESRSFVMASTRSNELEKLRDRLDALTTL